MCSNFYGRENSFSVLVNSTFYGSDAGKNTPVLIYGTGAADTEAYIISCTVAGNKTNDPAVCIGLAQVDSKVMVYNTIVSGNEGVLIVEV